MPRTSRSGVEFGICILDSTKRPAYWLKSISPDGTVHTTLSAHNAKHWKTNQGALNYLCAHNNSLPDYVVKPFM